MPDTDFFINPSELPLSYCLLEGPIEHNWDVLSKKNYRDLEPFELEDAGYPPGGYIVGNVESAGEHIVLEKPHNLAFVVYYYLNSGVIVSALKYNSPEKVREFITADFSFGDSFD